MSGNIEDEWLRFQMMSAMGNCEVCGALATSVVRDLVALLAPDAPGQVQQGKLHYFCAEHHRESVTSRPPSDPKENGTV